MEFVKFLSISIANQYNARMMLLGTETKQQDNFQHLFRSNQPDPNSPPSLVPNCVISWKPQQTEPQRKKPVETKPQLREPAGD